jgi:hypothetical protein
MITKKGKSVVSKYLIGQTPAYASYIAIGCGATPALPGSVLDKTTLEAKEALDFEMLRVPVISKGYVTENGVSKLVLTAQIPSESRYGITEVGIYPAASNPVAVNNDSRALLKFENNEQWVYASNSSRTVITDGSFTSNSGNITWGVGAVPFFANSFDQLLQSPTREIHNEIPRNGSYALIAPGNLSTIDTFISGGYLLISNPGINLSNSSPTDKLKIALSVLPKLQSGVLDEAQAKVVVEFSASDTINETSEYARATFTIDISDQTDIKRYFVGQVDVKDIATYNGFSWSNANYLKVYIDMGSNAADVVVALDGLRVDNLNSLSPIYGLVGYTIIKNSSYIAGGSEESTPVVKDKDKTNFIEFRFQAEVV